MDIFDVKVLDNPAPFTNPLQFEITYDVREPLKEGMVFFLFVTNSLPRGNLLQQYLNVDSF